MLKRYGCRHSHQGYDCPASDDAWSLNHLSSYPPLAWILHTQQLLSCIYTAAFGLCIRPQPLPPSRAKFCAGALVRHSYGHWLVKSGTVAGGGKLNGCNTVQIGEPVHLLSIP